MTTSGYLRMVYYTGKYKNARNEYPRNIQLIICYIQLIICYTLTKIGVLYPIIILSHVKGVYSGVKCRQQ